MFPRVGRREKKEVMGGVDMGRMFYRHKWVVAMEASDLYN